MSKHNLQVRPVYHQGDSIEAHLTIVFAALAVSRWIKHQTGWSPSKFVKTGRRDRTFEREHEHFGLTPLPEQLGAYLKQKQGGDETGI